MHHTNLDYFVVYFTSCAYHFYGDPIITLIDAQITLMQPARSALVKHCRERLTVSDQMTTGVLLSRVRDGYIVTAPPLSCNTSGLECV